ncbi:MAG TPA: MOSC domain-containing protein [Rhizomicrobium sp.]|jgi:MOSC domain-containing protein YiiM|nr:MOSC domain-containing protein [Rhizomicrobium sp.]
MPPRLLSVNCGTPRIIGEENGRPVFSAIGKSPVESPTVFFGRLGIEGDAQANNTVHGGPDQAVCVYSADHWPWWRDKKNFDCAAGAFGENLTVLGADEESVGIGDRFAWGDVILEVTQPRGPCANVDLHHRRSGLAQTMTLFVRCGWYMRVLHEGAAATRDATIEHSAAGDRPSIREAFAARHNLHSPLSLRQRVHDHPALGHHWRRAVARTFA